MPGSAAVRAEEMPPSDSPHIGFFVTALSTAISVFVMRSSNRQGQQRAVHSVSTLSTSKKASVLLTSCISSFVRQQDK